MTTCSFANCKKKPYKDGLCTNHIPKAKAVSATVHTVALARADGATDVNAAFASLAASQTQAAPYQQRIEAIRSSGPTRGGEENVHDVLCLHDTQPSNNITVWYSWSGNGESGSAMTVWGLGSHKGGSGAGNKKYTMTWFDGTSKNWTRA